MRILFSKRRSNKSALRILRRMREFTDRVDSGEVENHDDISREMSEIARLIERESERLGDEAKREFVRLAAQLKATAFLQLIAKVV